MATEDLHPERNQTATGLRRDWRYVLASLFLLWHSTAMFLGPFPDSQLKKLFYTPFRNYLTLFYMENRWAFFAPGPLFGRIVKYDIETASGRHLIGPLTFSVPHNDVNYFRLVGLFDKVNSEFPDYRVSIAKHLCKLVAAQHPTQVSFSSASQKFLTANLYRVGRTPFEKDFLTDETIPWTRCDGGTTP